MAALPMLQARAGVGQSGTGLASATSRLAHASTHSMPERSLQSCAGEVAGVEVSVSDVSSYQGVAVAASAAAVAAAGMTRASRARRRRVRRSGASMVLRGALQHDSRDLAGLARTALSAAAVDDKSPAVLTEAEAGDAAAPLLVKEWEEALKGRRGDVWTEPEAFKELLGPLAAAAPDEKVGTLNFSRLSAAVGADRDIVLYIPGIDFLGTFAAAQFRGLAEEHELWRCYVTAEDRTPFETLVRHVETWIRGRLNDRRRVVIFGESFGGLLSLAVALRLGPALKGLVVVNPATSFGRTPWSLLGRAVAQLPDQEVGPMIAADNNEVLQEMNRRAEKSPYAYVGSFALSAAAIDGSQLGRVASTIATAMMEDMARGETKPTSELSSFLTFPEEIARIIPPGTLRFRLRAWLRDGSEAVGSELRTRAPSKTPLPPTLFVHSSGDNLLGSAAEAKRLDPLLKPRCKPGTYQTLEIEDAGHFPLDSRIDLAALLRESPIEKLAEDPKDRDYVGDYEFPSLEKLEAGSKAIEPIAQFFSPVFCSVDPADGKRHFGIAGVPDPSVEGRPVLLVGNHQLGAFELGPIIREFLVKRGFTPRGLAHPINFMKAPTDDGGAIPREPMELPDAFGLPFELRSVLRAAVEAARAFGEQASAQSAEDKGSSSSSDGPNAVGEALFENFGRGEDSFAKWGGVPVNARNFFRLLQRGECVLLFPGGAIEAAFSRRVLSNAGFREEQACHGPGDKYKLKWPRKTDFVRAAARFDAIVVPFGSVGLADSFRLLKRDGPEAAALKALNPGLADQAAQGRQWKPDGGLMPQSESLVQPEVPPLLPRLPTSGQASPGLGDRIYVSFGAPVDLRDLNPKDRDACDKVYGDIQKAVEEEIAWLLQARVKDPYRDFIRRQAYERIANVDSLPIEIPSGPLRGNFINGYGIRAPSFEL